MALICLIGEVGSHDTQACHTLPFDHDIGTYSGIEQTIGRRCCLCIVGTVVMVLLEVIVHAQRDKGVVQHTPIMQDFPLDIGLPTRSRSERQILGFLGLMQLYGIDQREARTQVQEVPGMNIHGKFATQQLGIATIVAVGHELIIDDLTRAVNEDIVVDTVAEQRELRVQP